ncbi:MAG: hypothetical protein E7402_01900 [Ruminococcaceae bacterium]|nr:hypothetical protein [Oscillospiraceae bacterium]
MQSSILDFFAKLFHGLALWFNESLFGRFFNALSARLAVWFRHSLPGRFFAGDKTGHWFNESLFGKCLLFPLSLCRKCAALTGRFFESCAAGSSVLWLLRTWHSVSSRVYGIVLCAFSVSYLALSLAFSQISILLVCVLSALFLLSVLLILANRSLKSLFKGSRILTAFGGLFCPIRKDVDSKLFLKDPEILSRRPLLSMLIGCLLGVASFFLTPSVFCLSLGAFLYGALVLSSVSFGVFTVIWAAPILPTMVLAACSLLTGFSFLLRLLFCREYPLRSTPLAGYIAVFALTMVLGTLNSFTFIKSLQILFIHFAFIQFYFVAYQTLHTEKKWRAALTGFLLVAGLVSLYGIYQNFTGVSSTASWVDKEMFNQIKVRVYSTFDNPNVLGEYLVLLTPLMLAVIWRSPEYGRKTVYSALLLTLAACLIFTWSRGAWLGLMFAVALFLLVMDKRWSLFAVLGVFMLPMLLASGSAVAERILSIGNTADTSTAYRVSIWQASVTMLRDFGLAGIGSGSDAFSMIYPKYALAGANYALHSHNLFLQIWIENGIMGLLAFLALILAYIKQNVSLVCYQNRGHLRYAVAIASAMGVAGFLFQGLTDNVWYNYKMVLLFWVVLAISSAAASMPQEQSVQERSRA